MKLVKINEGKYKGEIAEVLDEFEGGEMRVRVEPSEGTPDIIMIMADAVTVLTLLSQLFQKIRALFKKKKKK